MDKKLIIDPNDWKQKTKKEKTIFAENQILLVSTLNLIDYFTYSEKQTNKKERLSRIELMIKILEERKGELKW